MLTARRWAARITLVLLAIAALWVLWMLRISVTSAIWPFYSGHHPRVLVFVGGIAIWVVAACAMLVAALAGLWRLWKEATGEERVR